MNRDQIIASTHCKTCGAKAGTPCWDNRGHKPKQRKRVHPIRAKLATGIKTAVRKKSPKRKKFENSFYASWEWKKTRYEALKINGQRCQCCGWRPGDTESGYLVVDHIRPRSKSPELSLEVSNLQVLCNDCNMGKSNVYEDDFREVEDWFASIMREK